MNLYDVIFFNFLCHLFQKSELVPQLEHRLTDDALLGVVFGFQASQRHLRCLLVSLGLGHL